MKGIHITKIITIIYILTIYTLYLLNIIEDNLYWSLVLPGAGISIYILRETKFKTKK